MPFYSSIRRVCVYDMKTKIVKRIALMLFALFISVQTGCVSTVIDDDVASVVEQPPSVVSGRNSGPEFGKDEKPEIKEERPKPKGKESQLAAPTLDCINAIPQNNIVTPDHLVHEIDLDWSIYDASLTDNLKEFSDLEIEKYLQNSIQPNQQFLVITLSVHNPTELEKEVYFNNLRISEVDEELRFIQNYELEAFSQCQYSLEDRKYGTYILRPDETLDAKLCYIVSDEVSLHSLFMPLFFTGAAPNDETEWLALSKEED